MKIYLLIILILLCASFGFGQKSRFAVDVIISANADIKADAASYVKRELRSLGDVDVTKGQFVIFVSIMKVKNGNYKFIGYSIAYNAIENIVCHGETYFNIISTNHYVTGTKALRTTLESIVTDFDKSDLEPRRKK